jgi:6-pyruvoyl-tetrahydropterin synthase
MNTRVARLYRFRARHSLPEEWGEPWSHVHEHDYTIEIVAAGGTPTDELDEAVRGMLELEGTNINEVANPSTVEHLAERLLDELPDWAISVRVWEDQARWGSATR